MEEIIRIPQILIMMNCKHQSKRSKQWRGAKPRKGMNQPYFSTYNFSLSVENRYKCRNCFATSIKKSQITSLKWKKNLSYFIFLTLTTYKSTIHSINNSTSYLALGSLPNLKISMGSSPNHKIKHGFLTRP